MKAELFNLQAEKIGEVTLPKAIFESEHPDSLIAQAVRVYLSNQRTSHAKVKDRGEVAGTTKKMWAQKGTGRARHSSAKAPQFVGGGSAHGPQGNQNYDLKLTKKMKKAAISAILTKFAQKKAIIAIDKIGDIEPKTKVAWNFIDKMENASKLVAESKKIGIITTKPVTNVKRAFGNIPGFSLLSLSSLNVYNLSNLNCLIFTQKAIESLAK